MIIRRLYMAVKTTIISIPEEYMEDLREFNKKEYAHLSFNKMFVDITIREMKRKKGKK
jgi:hypothetical protein